MSKAYFCSILFYLHVCSERSTNIKSTNQQISATGNECLCWCSKWHFVKLQENKNIIITCISSVISGLAHSLNSSPARVQSYLIFSNIHKFTEIFPLARLCKYQNTLTFWLCLVLAAINSVQSFTQHNIPSGVVRKFF